MSLESPVKKTPLEEAEANVTYTKNMRDLAAPGPGRAKAQEAYQRALVHRDRLLDAFNTTMTERKVVTHPKFVASLEAIFGALRPYPEAMAAVVTALKALDTAPVVGDDGGTS